MNVLSVNARANSNWSNEKLSYKALGLNLIPPCKTNVAGNALTSNRVFVMKTEVAALPLFIRSRFIIILRSRNNICM